MRMRKMHTQQCLLYSAAMVLDADPEILITEIGHDGKYLAWSPLGSPEGEVNYHIQEIMECFMSRGYALVPIDVYPITKPEVDYPIDQHEIWDKEKAEARFIERIKYRNGILIGRGKNGLGHAAAWNGEKVYDPNGAIYDLDDFEISQAWLTVFWRMI